jgi:superoxide dismutase
MTRFGSGWAWLIEQDGKLVVVQRLIGNPMDVAEVKRQSALALTFGNVLS